jgi:hypothetical protein
MTNRLPISLGIVLAVSLLGPRTLWAQQSASKTFAAFTTDSTAWQRVVVYVVGALSTQIVGSAADPSPQPWQLQLPSDDPQRSLLYTQLRTILRARQTMPADTLVRALEIGPLLISNDTARVEVRFQETRMCPGTGRTTGSGWSTTVLVPRDSREKVWGAAFSRSTLAGDRVGC